MTPVLIALDYGRKHTGVAVSQTPIAEPYKTISTNQLKSELRHLIEQIEPEGFVFGLSEGEMARETKKFAQELASHFNLPIYFTDETLSSQETRKKLAKAGTKKTKREGKIDHYVAARLLQDFIDQYPDLSTIPPTATINPSN